MYIQYQGFKTAANARVYSFQVLALDGTRRDFTVEIQSDTNHWAALKLQDGPGICFERLEQALDQETAASGAESHLHISAQDIRDYLRRHNPPAKSSPAKFPAAPSAESSQEPSAASPVMTGRVPWLR